jgi:hypothetical protein
MINVMNVEPGTRLKLVGGVQAEVVENMQDGMWLMVRYLDVPNDPKAVGTEELAHAQDIVDIV